MNMKRTVLIFALALISASAFAQNRWSVYGGINITKKNETCYGSMYYKGTFETYFNDKSWTPGGFVGIAYDIKFKHNLSLQPALEYNIINQKANYHYIWHKTPSEYIFNTKEYNQQTILHTLTVPVLVNYRISVSDKIGLRFGVGPYLQAAVGGKKCYYYGATSKINDIYKGCRKYQFTVGIKAEAALETGDHLSYVIGFQRPFCEGAIDKAVTINAGVRYTF